MKRKMIWFTFIIILSMGLTGCWSSREVDKLALATTIGIDRTSSGYLLTVQVINPRAIASERKTNEATVVVYKEEGEDLPEIFKRMITQTSRKIHLSHVRIVIFGERFANEGIKNTLDFLTRYHEFRTDFYFAVAKGASANSILEVLTPLETIPSIKMYSTLNSSESVWAATKTIKILELINSIITDGKSPVMPGIEIVGDGKLPKSNQDLQQTGIKQIKFSDLGIFKKDKLTGWLNEHESKGYNYIMGNVKSSTGFIKLDGKEHISLEVLDAKSKISAYLVNGRPAIYVEIYVTESIESVVGDMDVSKKENIDKISKLAKEKLMDFCSSAVRKAQKDIGSDIFGFGGVIHRSYPKIWKTIKDDWDNQFKKIPVKMSVNIENIRTGAISKSFFMEEKE